MRNEMIGAVVRRAIEHPEFRKKLMADPDEALRSHGFALNQTDLAEIGRIRETMGNDDESASVHLKNIAHQYGLEPRTS
ncbi:MAG TPA: hypothetical protein VNM92_06145 [Thermoanaerobaculia bacterium]|nr:hypothetical protein [Thermoanaerobaculia bacterium]